MSRIAIIDRVHKCPHFAYRKCFHPLVYTDRMKNPPYCGWGDMPFPDFCPLEEDEQTGVKE